MKTVTYRIWAVGMGEGWAVRHTSTCALGAVMLYAIELNLTGSQTHFLNVREDRDGAVVERFRVSIIAPGGLDIRSERSP